MRITVSELKRIIKEEVRLAEINQDQDNPKNKEAMDQLLDRIVNLIVAAKQKIGLDLKNADDLANFQTELTNKLQEKAKFSDGTARQAGKTGLKTLAAGNNTAGNQKT